MHCNRSACTRHVIISNRFIVLVYELIMEIVSYKNRVDNKNLAWRNIIEKYNRVIIYYRDRNTILYIVCNNVICR